MSSSEVRTVVSGDGTRMQQFMDEIFQAFQRAEQRRWAQAYLWGLIHAPGKKTPRRLALAKPLPSAAAHGLHQFINASPWDWQPVRNRLALRAAASTTPRAWTVTELIIPKRGEHSVGVHRRIDRNTGRAVNCQRALGLLLVTDAHCLPVDWSLVLDRAWNLDAERRRRARVPPSQAGRTAGSYVIDYAGGIAAQPPLRRIPWVLDLTRCDESASVLVGLARQRVEVVCEVSPEQVVLTGRRTPAASTVSALGEDRCARQTYVTFRQTTAARTRTVPIHMYTNTVRLPSLGNDGEARPYRVLERPDPDGRQPARYWITSLTDRRVVEILRLARSRVAALSTVSTLQKRFGVLDFEGRSYPGWHRHMTMASAAYAYECLYRSPGATPPPPATSPLTPPARLTGALN
ncbi:IS701 family transposase [Streptomyces sp. QTS137]